MEIRRMVDVHPRHACPTRRNLAKCRYEKWRRNHQPRIKCLGVFIDGIFYRNSFGNGSGRANLKCNSIVRIYFFCQKKFKRRGATTMVLGISTFGGESIVPSFFEKNMGARCATDFLFTIYRGAFLSKKKMGSFHLGNGRSDVGTNSHEWIFLCFRTVFVVYLF